MTHPSPPPELLRQAAQDNTLLVLLSNHGNPDYGQDPYRPVWGAPAPRWVGCNSLEHAAEICRAYIAEHDLGGGNWSEAKVLDGQGQHVASISYNGRIWPKRANTEPAAPAPAPQRPRGG